MAGTIQGIFISPPIAIARLGGSTTPQDAYGWVQSSNPRSKGETTITPDWSLEVRPDGTVTPVLPSSLSLREGPLIRPVCPFLELWALVGEPGSNVSALKETPLTPSLLAGQGLALNDLTVKLDAKNSKVARRTGNPELQYGTFPSLEVAADSHVLTPILASSPPGVPASRRMIPANRSIPLGFFQVLKSRPQPAPDQNQKWTLLEDGNPLVNVEVIRFRFTPARGHFYGPPQSAQSQPTPRGNAFPAVEPSRAFLSANAGWAGFDAQVNGPDAPTDTYDGADVGNGSNPSLGVIDDTCEARIEVALRLPGPTNQVLTTSATVFVAPPDFAPDRRPFLSLADELNDRVGDSGARTRAMTNDERDIWVEDLFERIYETVSLFNLDFWRARRGIMLTGGRLATSAIPNDHTPEPRRALGGRDALRNRMFPIAAPSQNVELPLSAHARMRHRALADLDNLRDFIALSPGRLASLIRAPFEAESGEVGDTTTMRMPPFMRNSNALPLTLAAWQYELLMDWVRTVEVPTAPLPFAAAAKPVVRKLSEAAVRRRSEVLNRISHSRRVNPPGGK
jgi:hypothetical protein